MKIGILTDSACNLSIEYINSQKNLKMVPLLINIDDKFYRDQQEIKSTEVYEKIYHSTIMTSLPKLEDMEKALNEFKKEGYTDVIIVSISSGLSGTFNGFQNIANQTKDIKIHLYDTKTLGMGEGYMVQEVLKYVDQKLKIEEIFEKLDKFRFQDSIAMFTVETLKWLRKGGRIGKVEGTIGEILHVKPIVVVNDEGVYVTLSKSLGLKRTYMTMRKKFKEFFGDSLVDITIHYGANIEAAKEMKKKLASIMNINNIQITQLTPVLGVHTGPEMIAIIGKRV